MSLANLLQYKDEVRKLRGDLYVSRSNLMSHESSREIRRFMMTLLVRDAGSDSTEVEET